LWSHGAMSDGTPSGADGKVGPQALASSSARRSEASSSSRSALKLAIAGVLFVGGAWAIVWVSPRERVLPIQSFTVDSSAYLVRQGQAALVVPCVGPPMGVVTHAEFLEPEGSMTLDVADGMSPSAVVASKGWFGSYSYALRRSDGSTVPMRWSSRYVACNR